ncbi:transposase-like zinc-binding domain-containing protein [Pseudoscardovia suis]|uniref:IS1/IS1595 family N-terminal zinc-binding domain-containing protein n=1 Tax=Pseudoscardovia suis TaxID=987063 RepID=UPI003B8489F5
MRTRSNRAPECGLCGARMKKNGHDRLGRQRWMCPGCSATETPRNPTPQSNGPTCTCPSSTPEREV